MENPIVPIRYNWSMRYYEVLIASGRYRGGPLTYCLDKNLVSRAVVTVPLRGRRVTGFVASKVNKPPFAVKPIAAVLSEQPLPAHCLALAKWLSEYYACSLGEALSQFAPSRPSIRRDEPPVLALKAGA